MRHRRMRLALLILVALPAFSGFPLRLWTAEVVDGITWAQAGYMVAVYLAVAVSIGLRALANGIAVASLITLPVILGGGSVAFAACLLGWGPPPAVYAPHYGQLCITMLTVLPLSLALVALVPFHRIERRLLQHPEGVSRWEKRTLMFLRVFNHIVYSVIPGILEVVGEEGGLPSATNAASGRFRGLRETLVRVGVEGICQAVQHIPLWAVEIAGLPQRRPPSRR